MDISNLLNVEFKVMFIRMLNSMKKDRKHKKSQLVIKNALSEINNILEGLNNRLDEAKDLISDLEDKVERRHLISAAKRKKM